MCFIYDCVLNHTAVLFNYEGLTFFILILLHGSGLFSIDCLMIEWDRKLTPTSQNKLVRQQWQLTYATIAMHYSK